MPNWCSYSVVIKGDTETIKTLDKVFTLPEPEESWDSDGIHDFTLAHPCPDDLQITSGFMAEDRPEYAEWKAKQEANKEKYGYADWYWWCVHNWGTKWPPAVSYYDVAIEENGVSYINAHGQSAWSPPSELFQYITATYPVEVTISYEEGGMCFAGVDAYKAGEQVYNGYFEYDDIPRIKSAIAKMNELEDCGSDDFDEAWQEMNDAVLYERDTREIIALRALEVA